MCHMDSIQSKPVAIRIGWIYSKQCEISHLQYVGD